MASRSDSPDDEGNTLGGNNVEDHALSGDHSQWRTESSNGKKIKSHYKLLIRDHADIVTEKTMKYSNLKNFNANGKKKIMLDLTNQRIKLRGDVLSFMVRYAGECARNWTYYPLSSKNWRAMDNGLKTRAWEKLVLTMFHIEPHQMKDARRWWDRKVAPAWSKARLALWRARKKHARENRFSADWVITETPRGVPSNDWLMFITYVQSPEFEKTSVRRNKGNIALKKSNHHGGSRSLDRFTEEVVRETGQPPSRGQMFIKCHQRTNGTYMKETTKMIADTIIQLEAVETPTFLGPNDCLALAPENSEHRGQVRAFSLRFTPTMDFGGGDSLLDFLLLSSSSIVSVTSKPPAGLHPSRAEFEAMNRMVQECQEMQARIKQIEQKFYASIGYVDTPLHPSQPHMYVQPHPAPLAPSSPARRDDATEDMYDQLHTTHPAHTSEPPIELTVSPLHPSQPHMYDQPHPAPLAPSSPARRDDATEDMFHTAHPTHTSEPSVSREEFEATKRQLQECKEKLDEAYHRVAQMVHNYQASVGLVATPLHSSQPHLYCQPHPTPSSYVSKKDGTEDMVGEYMKQP